MAAGRLSKYALFSIVAAVCTIGMKSTAYALTGSAGLLSDALESVVNLVAAFTAYFSLWYAARPADDNHAYGHEKIEFFASGMVGLLILLAGVAAIAFAIERLFHPKELSAVELGVVIALAAAGVNFAVGRLLISVGRRAHSIVLESDGEHLMADVYTTVAVVVGLSIAAITKIHEIDALLAMAVGVLIGWTGFRLIRRSVHGLMDHALEDAEMKALRDRIQSALPANADYHALRTRRAGRRTFAEFHLLVSGAMPVRDAHAVAHKIEADIRTQFPLMTVTIHIEPIDDRTSWEDVELVSLDDPISKGPPK